MLASFLQDLTLRNAVICVFVLCVLFMLVRGIARSILTVTILCGAFFAAFAVWQRAPTWSVQILGKPVSWLTTGLPVLAFLITWFTARKLLRPLAGGKNVPPQSAKGFLMRVVLSIIPTALLLGAGALVIQHFGSVGEILSWEKAPGKSVPEVLAVAEAWKNSMVKIVPHSWLAKLDPSTDPLHLSLAKSLVTQRDLLYKPTLDPLTGRPYPRAVIVDEPELNNLLRDDDISVLLRHPLFQKALHDPKVRSALGQN